MTDDRRLYMKRLLRIYKRGVFETPTGYTLTYTRPDGEECNFFISHNEGIDMVIQYIDELEHKVDELQYIEKAIDLINECGNP